MAFPAKAVANYFLQRGGNENIAISPMKLQKLLYYAQGWHLGFTGQPIIDEQIECWPYGPVVTSLFHHFKEFGCDPITRLANDFQIRDDEETGESKYVMVAPRLPAETASESMDILNTVWEAYKDFSAVKLSNMTHKEGGPWSRVYKRLNGKIPRGTDIPMPLIRRHFASLLQEA